jgi:hypothetical protein
MYGYVNSVLSANCAPEIISLAKYSHNITKELSESYAAVYNMRSFINNGEVVCIGDGALCLTGAMFSLFSKNNVVSIDPVINADKVRDWVMDNDISRLRGYKGKYQDVIAFDVSQAKTIVCVHAHVTLTDVIKYYPCWDYLYSNPCCFPEKQTFSEEFIKGHNIELVMYKEDKSILSPHNKIYIYKNNNKQGSVK